MGLKVTDSHVTVDTIAQTKLSVTVTETVAHTVQAEWRHHAQGRRTARKWTQKLQQNRR